MRGGPGGGGEGGRGREGGGMGGGGGELEEKRGGAREIQGHGYAMLSLESLLHLEA